MIGDEQMTFGDDAATQPDDDPPIDDADDPELAAYYGDLAEVNEAIVDLYR